MTKKTETKPAIVPGVTRFGVSDDIIAPPAREVRDNAKAAGEAIGFVSDNPAPAPQRAAKAPRPKARHRPRAVLMYPCHYSLRMTDEDRDRFDDYAHKHRIPKGEAMTRLLDLADAAEAAEAGKGGSGDD